MSVAKTFGTLELPQGILQYLPPSTIIRFSRVSKSWKAAVLASSPEMKEALMHSTRSRVIDLWTCRRPGTPSKANNQPKPYFPVNINKLLLGSGAFSIREWGGLNRQHNTPWFIITLPNSRRTCGGMSAYDDLRREMVISDTPTNHVEVLRYNEFRTRYINGPLYRN